MICPVKDCTNLPISETEDKVSYVCINSFLFTLGNNPTALLLAVNFCDISTAVTSRNSLPASHHSKGF